MWWHHATAFKTSTSLHVPVSPGVTRLSHQGLLPVWVCTATCLICNNLSQLLISGTIIQIAMNRQWSILAKQAGLCTFSPFVRLPYPPCIARHTCLARVKQSRPYPPGQSRKDITSVKLSITSLVTGHLPNFQHATHLPRPQLGFCFFILLLPQPKAANGTSLAHPFEQLQVGTSSNKWGSAVPHCCVLA